MRNFYFSLALLLSAYTSLWAAPVPITGGIATPSDASAGESVTNTANAASSGERFAKWITTGVTVLSPGAASTTFTVPEGSYSIEALYCDQDLLAYEGFDVEMGVNNYIPLHSTNSGSSLGWENVWDVQNGNTSLPGFCISNIDPLKYDGLASSNNYAQGGGSYLGSGRKLDRSAEGAFADYLNEQSKIGKSGQTLWISALYRKDVDNVNAVFYLVNDGTTNSGLGEESRSRVAVLVQDNEFALRLMGASENVTKTGIALEKGKTYLVVLKLEFGDGTDAVKTKASLYINPTDLSQVPAQANASAESGDANIPFVNIGWNPQSGANAASIDEIRFGKTYASVVPAAPTYDDAVTDITISSLDGGTQLARGNKTAMKAIVAPSTANPEVTWSIVAGTGNAIIGETSGILTGLKNGTIKVVATSADGNYSKEYDMEITDAEFLPVITAVSTTPGSAMAFSIDFNPNDTIANFESSMIQMSGSSNPTTLKLSGSFPKFTVNVLGMTEDGDLTLTIPDDAVKLKYDENYGNKKATGTMQYSRYFPSTTGLTFAYFNGGDLTETVSLGKERFTIDAGNPFLASIPFDETKAVFENTTGGAAFKGGISINHSDGEKNQGIEQITNYSTPSLRSVNEGSRYGSFALDNSGNSDATTSAAYQDIIASFVWTKDQFVNGFNGSKIALDNQSTMRLNVNEVMGNYRFSSIHFLIKNGSQYYISKDSVRDAGMFVLADFNNSAEKLWLEYDPTTLDLPGDWTEAKSVDFDDVQVVGFIYKTSHQYHKAFQFDFFSIDGIKADPPVVTFDVKGKSGLDRETPIVATADVTMKKAGGLEDITTSDIPNLFVLKKGNAEGEDIAFTGSIDEAAKVITITPSNALAFNTTYYVALKNEVVANVLGYATPLTEATFTTVADTTALVDEIATAQTKYNNAVEGSEIGQYDAGAKDMLSSAIASAQNVVDNAATKSQEEIDLAKDELSRIIGLFDLAEVKAATGNEPVITFDIENNAVGVDVAGEFKATSNAELYKALDLSTITDASSFFVLKEGDKEGTDVAFAASLDATRKVFTISPSETLKPNTGYYLALKNRVVADIDGNRAVLTETNFTTGCDTLVLHSWVTTAEAILANAEEGDRNGDYIAGSKAILQEAIDLAINTMRDPSSTQPNIDAQVSAIESAIVTFQGSIVEVNYDELDKSIKKGNDKMREADYSSYPENTRSTFETALDDAKVMRDNDRATQAEVDAAQVALDDAYDALIISGIEGANMDNVFIYPNPASDYIRINGISDISIRIIGANGAILYSQDNYNGESINISSFATGTYFLEVDGNTISFIKK